MDIRRFFEKKVTEKSKRSERESESDEEKKSPGSNSPEPKQMSSLLSVQEVSFNNDIGKWVGKSSLMTSVQKMEVLKRCWRPPPSYDFAEDAKHLKRKFQYSWLEKYSPWLAYSKHLKGALCLYCVTFTPSTVQGVQGSFAVRPFTRYKHMHEYCKNHVESRWHLAATKAAKSFLEEVPIDVQLVSAHQKLIADNRRIITSIISTIILCGIHSLPLRGKEQHEGILEDLIRLKIDSGDEELKRHMEGKKNSTYMSPQIQNEIINLCGCAVKDLILKDIKKSYAYSILTDETADISGREQLSIGVRFFDEEKMMVREEFLGFEELKAMDAKTIANTIDSFLEREGLDPQKCVGQGYDGCAAMAGKDGGVQKIIREKYKKALFFHCASHRLNLVVNDLNHIAEIRNTVSTIKDIINFFRESVLRRKYVPNIPTLCETRWSQKYKSISIFKKHFVEIVQGLEKLTQEGNTSTRKTAFQLHCAATKSVFIISTCIIAEYSALLEPVANILQSKNLDLLQCTNHIKKILSVVKTHRETADVIMKDLLISAQDIAMKILVEIQLPRVIERQQHRSNPPATSPDEYWKQSILILYLDSFTSALENRFLEDNVPAFSILSLHPFLMLDLTIENLKQRARCFAEFYDLDGFEAEAELWYNVWNEKKLDRQTLKDLEIVEVIKEASTFFPATRNALIISIAQPCSTSTIERTFSTLRRIKTWLRSTMTENRLNGLCLMSIYKKLILEKKEELEMKVIEKFAENPRRLLL